MRTVLVAICVVTISSLSSSSLLAQNLTGGTGTQTTNTGNTNTGNTSTGNTSTANSNSGTTSGSGLTSTGTSGLNVPAGTSNTASQSFVGGNATQTFVGGSRQATNQQGTNRQFQAFQNTQQGMNQGMSTTGTPRQVKTALRVGFSFPTATSAQASGRLAAGNQASLNRYVTTRPEFTGINVDMNSEGVAVLTGSADSIEASRLAANLMRFQPGVRRVDNQVAVNR